MQARLPHSLLTGQAGVYRVASELLLRGLNVMFPAVDRGTDLIVESGVRIQVKCAHRACRNPYPQGAYWFKLHRAAFACGNTKITKSAPRVFSDHNDYVVLWGIEEDRFWIVPAPILDNRNLVVVGPDVWHRKVDMDALLQAKAEGLTQDQLAVKFGLTQMTVSRRLRGIHTVPEKRGSQQVREHEGRWDLITNHNHTR